MTKAFKRIASLMCVAIMMFTTVACGKTEAAILEGKDFSSKLNMSDYKGQNISYSVSTDEINDEYINNRLENYKKSISEKKTSDRTVVADNDIIVITIATTLDGETIESYTGETVTYQLGTNTLPTDIEKIIVGKNVGTEYSEDVTLGTQSLYPGKTVNVTFTVSSIIELVESELNDELAKTIASSYELSNDIDTVDKLKEYIRTSAEKQNDEAVQQAKETAIYSYFQSAITVNDYDTDEMDRVKKQLEQQLNKQYESYKEYMKSDMTFDEFMAQSYGIGDNTGTTYEQYMDTYSKYYCQQYMTYYTIASKEKIKLSQSDFDEYIKKYLTRYQIETYDELLEKIHEADDTFDTNELDSNLKKEALVSKVINWLIDNNNLTQGENQTYNYENETYTNESASSTDNSENSAEAHNNEADTLPLTNEEKPVVD